MKQKIIPLIFSLILLFSIANIFAESINYPQMINPLSSEELKSLYNEFKTLNNGTICNSLDEYGFVESRVCQGDQIVRKEITNKDAIIEIAKDTLIRNSKFTGVTDKSQLVVDKIDELPGCVLCNGSQGDMKPIQLRIIFKNQVYNNLEVEDTRITVFGDVEKIYRIDEHWYPTINLPEAVLSEEEAKDKLIGKELTYGDIAGNPDSYIILKEDLNGAAEKIILPRLSQNNIELRLAWKIPIGDNNQVFWYGYVDAINGDEFKIQQMFVTASGGLPDRTTTPTPDTKIGEGNYLYWLLGVFIILAIIYFFFFRKKEAKKRASL
jgi:hypothetical protein